MLKTSLLTKYYRKRQLWKTSDSVGVENLNLEISSGEIFGLLGQNGAGKTTTLKLILGLLFPTSGEILLFNKKLPDQRLIQRLGFVPEVPYFPKHLTVEEVLKLYGMISNISRKEIRKRAEEVLALVRMEAHKAKRIKECSKGMLQRLSLAQALVHDPQFLVMDEPVAGLDPLGLAQMREMILKLNDRGKTVLFSSHIISEVEKIAHRVGILVNGHLVKVLESKEWSAKNGGTLERIYVETVEKYGASDL